jgi:hypothetical protein
MAQVIDEIQAKARRSFFPADVNMGGPRKGETLWVVLHNTVSDDWVAEAIARYFHDNPAAGSTQEIVDSNRTEKSIPDEMTCQGAAGDDANGKGVHIEFCSMPTWKRVFWFRRHNRMIRRGAFRVARYCMKYNIPPRYLTVAEVRAGKRGITTHRTITEAFNVQGGHTDDGPPRGRTEKYVREYLAKMKAEGGHHK